MHFSYREVWTLLLHIVHNKWWVVTCYCSPHIFRLQYITVEFLIILCEYNIFITTYF